MYVVAESERRVTPSAAIPLPVAGSTAGPAFEYGLAIPVALDGLDLVGGPGHPGPNPALPVGPPKVQALGYAGVH
jgi:hypothetical protein